MNLHHGKLVQFYSLNYFYSKIIEEQNRYNSVVFIIILKGRNYGGKT
jgi:hypothetical protein